jgi:hypothetical protein
VETPTMKLFFSRLVLFIISTGVACSAAAQERTINYDPERNKIIPDKVFEIGLPLLVIILLANSLVTIFKIRAENRLKEKALDKNLSEATLVALFADNNIIERRLYLKWFIILLFLAFAFLGIYLMDRAFHVRSGFLATGLLCLFLSIGFLVYYRLISKN